MRAGIDTWPWDVIFDSVVSILLLRDGVPNDSPSLCSLRSRRGESYRLKDKLKSGVVKPAMGRNVSNSGPAGHRGAGGILNDRSGGKLNDH